MEKVKTDLPSEGKIGFAVLVKLDLPFSNLGENRFAVEGKIRFAFSVILDLPFSSDFGFAVFTFAIL